MKIFDQILMCLRNLFRRKVRTILTVTGVVVGCCAIIVMISLGIATSENQEKMLAQMGDLTMIEVYNYGSSSSGANVLDDNLVAQIQMMEGVEIASPLYRMNNVQANLYAGRNDLYEMYAYNIVGVYPQALELFGYELKEGRYLEENDSAFTVVVGEKTAYEFRNTKKRPGYDMIYPSYDPNVESPDPFFDITKEKLKLRTQAEKEGAKQIEEKVKVVGVLKEDYSKGYETSSGIFMNLNDLKKLETEYAKANGLKLENQNKGYETVKVKVKDIKYVEQVESAIQEMGFETYSMDSIRKPMQEQTRQQQLLLGGLGGISLLVAAIGITNTMIMSIYERTREIGIMKVLGCYISNIRSIFLMEAGAIGFLGGVIGIGLSYLISFGLNLLAAAGGNVGGMDMYYAYGTEEMATKLSVIPPWLALAALGFSVLIGLISGFYPANRAVKISALEAIKHE